MYAFSPFRSLLASFAASGTWAPVMIGWSVRPLLSRYLSKEKSHTRSIGEVTFKCFFVVEKPANWGDL